MKTVKDILYIMIEIYHGMWCDDMDITCGNCKYKDACTILCYAMSDFAKGGEYH